MQKNVPTMRTAKFNIYPVTFDKMKNKYPPSNFELVVNDEIMRLRFTYFACIEIWETYVQY